VSRRWAIVIAVVVISLVIAIAVVGIMLDRERDEARRAAAAGTSTTGVTSPYDFVELPDEADLDLVEEASLVSILLTDDSGKLTSYGLSAELPAAQALTEAVHEAKELDAEIAAEIASSMSTTLESSGTPDSTSQAIITFVLPTREILTFLADLDRGIIVRSKSAWQLDGDLRVLVDAAISSRG